MEILDSKRIPLKIHGRFGKFAVAWHWDWSITWRWLVVWRSGHFTWSIQKSDPNVESGYGWRHFNIGRLGSISVTWQPNMKRDIELV